MDICALPDGRVVTIRPIRPDDSEPLRLSHERLSPESRYRRFLAAKPHLSAADAAYLVGVDGCDHYALVATAPDADGGVDQGGETIVAVARFARLTDDPHAAEFAIVVADAWQHQGLGGELLGRLADAAVTRDVDRFSALVLAENVPIQRLIERHASGPVEWHRMGDVAEAEFGLPVRPMAAPAIIAACAGS